MVYKYTDKFFRENRRIIEMTKNITNIMKQFFHRSVEPTAGDKKFRRIFGFGLIFFIVSLCILLLTGFAPFSIWLFYSSFSTIIVIICVAIICRIWDIAKKK